MFHELSYGDPYVGSRTIYQIHLYTKKGKYDMGPHSTVGAAFFHEHQPITPSAEHLKIDSTFTDQRGNV